ncbi:hypothetical protein CO659_15765 [Rhizobium sp. S9]|nr:hypothetical protein CO659_15765 [Rhizobium sp. S9]
MREVCIYTIDGELRLFSNPSGKVTVAFMIQRATRSSKGERIFSSNWPQDQLIYEIAEDEWVCGLIRNLNCRQECSPHP